MGNRHATGLAVLSIVLFVAAGANFTLRWARENGHFTEWSPHERTVVFLLGGGIALVLFLFFATLARALHRHGLHRTVTRLDPLSTLAIVLVAFFVLMGAFGGIRAALLSAGLIAFGVTLALQRPLLAIAGWGAIRFGRIFREGDRIEANGIVGDVLDIGLFATRLWEVGSPKSPLAWGGIVAPLRPTGRVVSVSNAVFLEHPVALPLGHEPRIFDEFVVRVPHGSDWRLARDVLARAGRLVTDPAAYAEAAREYRRLLQEIPTKENFDEAPRVLTNLEEGWVELRLRYLVDVRDRSHVRTRLAELWQEAREAHAERLEPPTDRKADALPPPPPAR